MVTLVRGTPYKASMGGSEFRSEPRGRLLATQHHLAPTLGLRRTCVELCYPAMATADSLLECYDPHLRACERMVRAEQRIESNVASKPFHVDYYQLVSIGNHCTHTPMDPPLRPRAKCIKVRIVELSLPNSSWPGTMLQQAVVLRARTRPVDVPSATGP